MTWEERAKQVYYDYGSFVDWEERFYHCPECGEPIYEDDWYEEELKEFICPICGFNEED